MSMLEPHHGVDEDLPDSGHRTSRPLVIAVVITLVIALTLLLVLKRRNTHDRGVARPTNVSIVRPTPAPHVAAGDFLVPGLSSTADTEPGSIFYLADLINESDEAISIDYPIELRGPGGVLVPVVFASIIDHAAADTFFSVRSRASGRPAALTTIAARQSPALLIELHIDCAHAAAEEGRPADQPAILVRVNGLPDRARFAFTTELGSFASAVHRACGN